MNNIIYHNPNWSKSRKSVEILKDKGIDFEIIHYIKSPPSINELKSICKKLNLKASQIIRRGERDFKENNLSKVLDDETALLNKMIQFPKIIERPIIIIGEKAVIGRPPENILDIL